MRAPPSSIQRDNQQRAHLRTRLDAGIAQLNLVATQEVAERLIDYVELLTQWNAVYNLTAVREPEQMIARHLLDSLSVAPFVTGKSLVDLGSGAGLPGIPLALLMPEREVLLVDSNGKKTRFLSEAIRALQLKNVRVENCRVEDIQGEFDCVTARAFATLEDMLTWGGHLLAPHGRWLAMKGQFPDAELGRLPAGFEVIETQLLKIPGLQAERHVIIVGRTLVAA